MKEIVVDEENIRIDTFIAKKLDISRSKIQKLIKENKIIVNGKEVNSSYLVKVNDIIIVNDKLDFDIHIKDSTETFQAMETLKASSIDIFSDSLLFAYSSSNGLRCVTSKIFPS